MSWKHEYAADEPRLAIVRATIARLVGAIDIAMLSLEELVRASVELDLIVVDDPRQRMLGSALAREEEDRRRADRSLVPTARALRKAARAIYETC